MSAWEREGQTSEWYTPPRIFDALGERFDLDVAAPQSGGPHVPADSWIHEDSLNAEWESISLWEVNNNCITPIDQKNALDAIRNCPQIPIISAPGKIVHAGWRLDAGSVSVKERGNSKGGREGKSEAPDNHAQDVKRSIQQLSKTSTPRKHSPTGSHQDAVNVIGKLQERECEFSGGTNQNMLSQSKRPTWRVISLRNGRERVLELVTQGEEQGLPQNHLTGVVNSGKRLKSYSAICAHTAEAQGNYTKTTSSLFLAQNARELFGAISFRLAQNATYQKGQGIQLTGAEMHTLSMELRRGSNIIGLSCRPFIWCNPPFGGRNGLIPWLDKFLFHGYGICLTPDRTSAEWWQYVNRCSDATLFIKGKVKFLRPDGSEGKSPGTGTTLFACGLRAVDALRRAETKGLGTVMYRRSGRD